MMRILFAIIFVLLVYVNTASALVWFTVARHVDTSFTSTTFDAAMTDVNERMRIDNNRCSDVPCTAKFLRTGSVGTFGAAGDGLDTVDSQAELDSVFGVTSHRVKVVTSLSRCAGRTNTSFIGCGTCGSGGFILERWVQGNVYVHEYGHNVMGCGHRDTCSGNIMHSASIGSNDSVNASECSSFGGKAFVNLCGNVYNGFKGPLTAAGGPYWVTCNVTVPTGQTLTVNPGVEIQFKGNNKITVNGVLNADGTTSQVLIYSNSDGYPSMKIDREMKIMGGGQILLH